MVTSKERDIILNAIGVLRSRRVRPSAQKIAWYVRRENLMSECATEKVLDEMVKSYDIRRVVYKGATSYRMIGQGVRSGGLRIRPPKTKVSKVSVLSSETSRRAIINAISSCGPNGGTKEDISIHLSNAGFGRLIDRLSLLLHREFRAGCLQRIETTHNNRTVVTYKLAPAFENDPITPMIKNEEKPSKASSDEESQAEEEEEQTQQQTPFAQLHFHLKLMQQQKQQKENSFMTMNDVVTSQPCVSPSESTTTTSDAPDCCPTTPSQNNQQLECPDMGAVVEASQEQDVRWCAPAVEISPTESVKPDSGNSEGQLNNPETGSGKTECVEDVFTQPDNTKPALDCHEAAEINRAKRGRPRKLTLEYCSSSYRGRQLSQRTKRARKVFDPSEGNNLLSKKRSSPPDSAADSPSIGQQCDVCFQTSQSDDPFEELLVCHRCSAKAHPACLGYSTELAIRSRHGPWTCMDCKHCAICNMDHNIGTLIFCDECDCAYHLTCHQPALQEQPQGTWICYSCSPRNNQTTYDYLLTHHESPVADEESRGSAGSWDGGNGSETEIPNAIHWTVENVKQYFQDKGFVQEAKAFIEQDIDGMALLMLTRQDVLTGLCLKLGPALKIYKHVRILQTRMPSPPLPT